MSWLNIGGGLARNHPSLKLVSKKCTFYLLLALLCVMPSLLWAEQVSLFSWGLTESEISSIKAGDIVSHRKVSDENIYSVEAFVLMNANAVDVFSILIDYEHLPDYAPYVDKIEVLQESYQDALVNFTLALPFGVEKRYRLHLTYEMMGKEMKMSWQSVPWPEVKPENSIVSSGYWHLKQGATSQETWVSYKTITDSGHVPFGLGWIVNHMSTVTILELLRKTKLRAEGAVKASKLQQLESENVH